MKRLLILLLTVFLLLAGCSKELPEAIKAPDVNKEIDLNNDKNDEPSNNNEEISGEESEAAAEEQPAENPVEETQEPATTEEPLATEPAAPVEPVIEEPSQEPSEAVQEDENNILKIKGLVTNEQKLSLKDLKSMNDIIFEADFYSLNSYGTRGYTHFKGVKLWDLLETKALIKPEASKITITAEDGYSMEFTIDQVKMEYIDETNPDMKYPMIIAWEEKGEEYSTDEGAPYKLVVGQKEPGDVNKPQWVSNIDVIIIE